MGNSPLTSSYLPGAFKPQRGPRGRRRDIVEVSCQQRLLDDLINPCIARVAGSGPSLLEKSPKEHIVDVATAQARLPYPQRKHIQQLKTEVPPGHVRVRFYPTFDRKRGFKAKPNLEAVLPLEANGEFDLGRVKRLWGLETCTPIDPVRWKVVEPGQPDALSPLAVHSLQEFYGIINVIEPCVTVTTLKKREVRETLVPHLESVRPRVTALLHSIEKYINETSLGECYDKAQQDVRYFDWCLKQWMAELSPWQQLLFLLIFFAMIVFFFFLTVLAPRPEKAPMRVRWAQDGLNVTTEQ
ncbi:hypothetical protein FPV67DRAFT_1110494 [Lyophyllum atratum]|nr:hypothetical protein FPV67DRAFT_1110494 [Lyophyllum atratum]